MKPISTFLRLLHHPESALDPIQIVRRFPRLEDREVVAFIAAGLAFGRAVRDGVVGRCAVLARPARSCAVRSRRGLPLRR
jgi:hypothetical protein